ncbi:hypothetical protein P8452_32910 [Trifolium repens]|nr:hypothetical protein P8452_32910 [Trifolium repens]
MIGHDITTCKWLRQQTVEDNSKQIVKVKKEAEKVMKYVAKQQHVPVIIPAQSSVVPEVPKADVPEVSKADKLITAVDVSHALVADAGKVVIDDEVTPKQDVETAYKARTAAPQITSFSMHLKDVTDEIVQGELAVSEPILQQITEPVDSEKMVDTSSDDGEEIVIETQLTRVGHVKDINSICWDVTGKRIASTSEDDVRVCSVFNGKQWTHDYLSKGKRFQSVIFHPRYHNVVVIGGYRPPSRAEVSFALLFAVDADIHMATLPADRGKPQKLHGQRNYFDIFVHDFLVKSGFPNTAESFRNEAQIIRVIPPEFDQRPRGILYDVLSYRGTSSQSQAPNVAAMMDTTPQIIREGYYIQHLSRLQSGQALLSCDFSPDGKIVASGGLGKKPFICYMDTVKVWNANTPASALYEFKHNGTVRSLDFEPLGRILCSSDNHDELKVWDLKQKFMISSSKEGGSLVRFQPGYGKFLAVAKQNVITIIEWLGLRVFNNLQGHVKDINSICWDVTGKRIASTSEDDVRVWSVFNGRQWTHEYLSKGKRFQSVIFHPRYHNVVVIGGHQCLELWILENGGQRHSLRASEVSITGLAATTAQSGLIASASNDSVVKIWK